jgi:hypothetical protein
LFQQFWQHVCLYLFLNSTLGPIKRQLLALYLEAKSLLFIKMDYSKSYMFFGVVLFVILYSQILTAIHEHDESSVTGESGYAYNLFLQVKCI